MGVLGGDPLAILQGQQVQPAQLFRAPQISSIFVVPTLFPSLLSSGQQDPILSVLLGGLELSLTPPMGKCWNEEGKPRAFVLREQKTSSACPWIQLLQTLQIGLVFWFAFKCFFSQCDFFYFLFFFCLEGVCLGDRAGPGLFIWPIQLFHRACTNRLLQAAFPAGFPMALQWPGLCVW